MAVKNETGSVALSFLDTKILVKGKNRELVADKSMPSHLIYCIFFFFFLTLWPKVLSVLLNLKKNTVVCDGGLPFLAVALHCLSG